MNKAEMKQYLLEHEYSTYERDAYDKFLKSERFNYDIKSIHITGTNGKGSVANYLYNIYLKAGYKVGLFNSPYLNDVTEMIKINGRNITDEEYLEIFNDYLKKFEKYGLSAFEIETFIAFTYFKKMGVDISIIEVGMGGYIDATNVITPILSIITSVSLEHTSYLGRSVSEIAENKAGIIKDEVPALVGKLEDSAMFAIREHCKEYDSPLHIVDDYHHERIENDEVIFDYLPYLNLKLHTRSLYQCKNASVAIEATNIVKDIIPVTEENIREGLYTAPLECRFEYIKDNLILDGAHNPEAMLSLTDTLDKTITKPIHVLFAVFRDKNVDSMLNILSKSVHDVTLTTFDHKRARTEEEFFLYLGDYNFKVDYKTALKEMMEEYKDDIILVTGSLAFVGVIRKYLNEN